MSTQINRTKTDMRRHQRILVPRGRVIHVVGSAEGRQPGVEGFVTVIGLDGMFFRTGNSQPPGTVLHLQFADAHVTFESDCTVRTVTPRGLGVQFTGITYENSQKLKSLVSEIKV
jgi:hypothetical protein